MKKRVSEINFSHQSSQITIDSNVFLLNKTSAKA